MLGSLQIAYNLNAIWPTKARNGCTNTQKNSVVVVNCVHILQAMSFFICSISWMKFPFSFWDSAVLHTYNFIGTIVSFTNFIWYCWYIHIPYSNQTFQSLPKYGLEELETNIFQIYAPIFMVQIETLGDQNCVKIILL